ncbi:MAG TPA: methyltransferase type 12 [Pelomicrobium sp.]|nr:methyltransferase type 12 [Pelomicrobium sp.]
MQKRDLREPARDPRVAFFQGFLRHPGQVGSVIPSSRFLERRLVKIAGVATARTVVELGPGTGGTTRALLAAMSPDARLLSIELDRHFVAILGAIPDRRLAVHHGHAQDIAGALASHGLAAPDVVVSGIPFSTIPPRIGIDIIRAVKDCLAPGGRFVAYQLRDRVGTLGRTVFGKPRVELELLNVPPMRVYCWHKAINGAHR